MCYLCVQDYSGAVEPQALSLCAELPDTVELQVLSLCAELPDTVELQVCL